MSSQGDMGRPSRSKIEAMLKQLFMSLQPVDVFSLWNSSVLTLNYLSQTEMTCNALATIDEYSSALQFQI
jgi:hypothetical protein